MKVSAIDAQDHRRTDHDIDPLFVRRWSPRALSGEAIAEEELLRLFEAARWAPSSYNNQPWRFLWARRDTPPWERFLDLLVEFNRSWAQHAAALVVIVSSTTFEHNGKPSRTHSFDAGAAWMSLALAGSLQGLVVHGMQGFDDERAVQVLGVPEGFAVEIMCAVGLPGDREALPETLRQREVPSGRKTVAEIAFEGGFPD